MPLRAGIDINQEAFREGEWKATPLWYAVSRGVNLPLAKHLLQRRSGPNHCLWAAAFRDDVRMITVLLDHGADIDAGFVAAVPAVEAQESTRVGRVGFLAAGSPSTGDPRVDALRQGFRELGYTGGRNLPWSFGGPAVTRSVFRRWRSSSRN